MFPRYSEENFPNILKLADGLKEIGKRHGVTAGQVTLAWILAQGPNVIPIPGTKKVCAFTIIICHRLDAYVLSVGQVPRRELGRSEGQADRGGSQAYS